MDSDQSKLTSYTLGALSIIALVVAVFSILVATLQTLENDNALNSDFDTVIITGIVGIVALILAYIFRKLRK